MRKYVEAREIEKEMQESRNGNEFVDMVEKISIKQMVENAKVNSRFGDKILMNIDPMYIHIPSWQRMCDVLAAQQIGNNYNTYKWEVPKLLYWNGILICEILEWSLNDAIHLFLDQGIDRRKMSPVDYYRAAIESGDENYIQLKEICNSHNVAVKGDPIENQVGIFTPITDGIRSIQRNGTELLNKIINLITELQWNGYADTYNGKAYTAKYIRIMHSIYAYYDGRTDEMEAILKEKCTGTKFFVDNLMELTQGQAFDALSKIVRFEMESPFRNQPEKTTKKVNKKLA